MTDPAEFRHGMARHGLLRFEPWKIAFTAFGAGAAALAAVIAALNYFHH
jgi:hypothetical protein